MVKVRLADGRGAVTASGGSQARSEGTPRGSKHHLFYAQSSAGVKGGAVRRLSP